MDLEAFLNEKLRFTEYFYDKSTETFFKEIKLIQEGKGLYLPENDPSYDPESGVPAFLNEYIDMNHCIEMIGYQSLSLLTTTWFEYLNMFLIKNRIPLRNKQGSKGTLYRLINSLRDYGIAVQDDDVKLIEDMVLTRNNVHHHIKLTDIVSYHRDKRPSHFSDKNKIYEWQSDRVYVNHDKLNDCICIIKKLSKDINLKYNEIHSKKYITKETDDFFS